MGNSTPSSELAGFGPPEDATDAHLIEGYGAPEPADDARPIVDVGPEARRARAGLAPLPSTVERGTTIAASPGRDPRLTLQGRNDQITTPEARAAAQARQQAEDPIRNDPLAGLIVQSIPAAGAGAVAGGITRAFAPGLAPLAQGAVQGAASSPDAPLTGAALGAIPGLPAAGRAAGNAIGEAAVRSSLAPPKAPGAVAKFIDHTVGAGAGAAIGHATGIPYAGYAGAAAGAGAASAARAAVTSLGRKLTESLASRHLARLASSASPDVVGEVAARYAARAASEPAPAFKMPDTLELNPLPEPPAPLRPGGGSPAPATPIDDSFWRAAEREWGVEGAASMKAGNHTTAGGATAVTPGAANDLVRLRAEGADLLGQLSKLRADGVEHAPPELAARAQEVMGQIAALEKSAADPFTVKAKGVAELVKAKQRGATKEQLAHRAKVLGIDDAVVEKIAKAQ